MKQFNFNKGNSKYNDVQVVESLLRKGADIKTRSGLVLRFNNFKSFANSEGWYEETLYVEFPREKMSNAMSGKLSFLQNYRNAAVVVVWYEGKTRKQDMFIGGKLRRPSVTIGDYQSGRAWKRANTNLNYRLEHQKKHSTSHGGHARTVPGSMKMNKN